MKNYNKYSPDESYLEQGLEDKVRKKIEKAGLFDKKDTFPLASLQFELTSRCNNKCKHCYNNSENDRYCDIMTAENWIAFSKYLVEKGGVFEVILSGGEPLLLGNKLFDLMDVLDDDGTIFMLITNGYLLNEQNIKKLEKYKYHWLQISIDGCTADYHDSFREKEGSWVRAIEAAKIVAQSKIPLKIAHCVSPYNLNQIDDMCELAVEIGANALTIGELCLSGRAGINQNLLLSSSQREYLLKKVDENRKKYEGIIRIKSSNSVKDGLIQHASHPNYGAVIRPDGNIRIDGMAPFFIGNVLEDDFESIWESKIYSCWKDRRVEKYISDFDSMDRNYNYINYLRADTRI